MQRLAFEMHLKEGQKEEYKKRHDEIWPELKHTLPFERGPLFQLNRVTIKNNKRYEF